ncbi:MAG: hypothetical protein IMZ64_14800 [Bacteroidetes bacterium]|nr:hypothetical protein [Bacteroidota bacterium]
MEKYIYCEDDFKEAMREALKEMFGYDLQEFIVDKSIEALEKYVNLYRFYGRNCPGCVCGNTECDFAYGRKEAKDCWEKAKKGELFDCPVRANGTLMMGPGEPLHQVDISDRNELPYPIVIEDEK